MASSISRFLPSTCDFCVRELAGLRLQLLVGLLQLVLLLLEQLLGRLERRGLLLQPGVGLAQLLLLALQLLGQRLRLLQQRLGPHVGRDRVEHDGDRLGELVEQGEVDVLEAVERGQLDDRLDLALEDDRQDDDVQRGRLAQAGADPDVVARDVGDQDPLLLEGALADQALADAELVAQALALAVGVGAGQLERPASPSASSIM